MKKISVLGFCFGLVFAFSGHQVASISDENTVETKDKIIRVSAIVNRPIEEAFDYFVINEKLEKWLAKKANVELKEGGKYELFWTPKDSDLTNNSTYGCKVLAFEKPYYLNVEWRGNKNHKGFMNNVRPLTNVTVIFSKLDDKKTKITLLHTGWRQGEDWETARKYFVNAWSGAFRNLKKLAENE